MNKVFKKDVGQRERGRLCLINVVGDKTVKKNEI